MRDFIYNVNGTEFQDTESFGNAWERAKELATKLHCTIERTVICGEKIRYEFFTKGGLFLDDRFRNTAKAKVF